MAKGKVAKEEKGEKSEKKSRKRSLTDDQRNQLKAMTRGLRNALKMGVPCGAIIGHAIEASQAE